MNTAAFDRLRQRFSTLYGPAAVERYLPALQRKLDKDAAAIQSSLATAQTQWDERDHVLITYGDQVQREGEATLRTLTDVLVEYGWHESLRTVHLLPCFPYSSDDGFSVIDYRRIDPALGSWEEVRYLRQRFQLMLDFVLNHASSQSAWFQSACAGEEPHRDYFLRMPAETPLQQVTRPRSSPLLSPYPGPDGNTEHYWTTFSADQVDRNYANPELLLEMIDIMLLYLQQGAHILRLDAIAYLWKELDSSCVHLPQTHAVVKLLRDVIDYLELPAWLLTETNVPHQENISYFGQRDEAHMVYQFSLPPLLLEALLAENASALNAWLADLQAPPQGCTYFNFTASHDGVGLRPLEGLLDDARLAALVKAIKARDGLASMRRRSDGSESPYELNVSYVSALSDIDNPHSEQSVQRFLASQAVMLALQGIPGIYFHSLVGTRNDLDGLRASGHARHINRHKYQADELATWLQDPDSAQHRIYRAYQHLLSLRRAQPAFHPDGAQHWVDSKHPALLHFKRLSPDQTQAIEVVANVSSQPIAYQTGLAGNYRDLISNTALSDANWRLGPFQVLWAHLERP